MNKIINIIGAGLAGCEAAYQAAKRGLKVRLFECKPTVMSKAHSSKDFAELVCSNSLKSEDEATASGLLKREMEMLDSLILRCARGASVPAGGALAVDRDLFSAFVTKEIKSNPLIETVDALVEKIEDGRVVTADGIVYEGSATVVATGPLTLGGINDELERLTGGRLYFYDAAAPIVSAESVDLNNAFFASRYGKGGEDDYINCPLEREEYYNFIENLIAAECVILHEFEKGGVFEGCMPVEVMAKRGAESLRFGPMRPVGFTDPKTGKRPYAVLQLRKENKEGTMLNLVGFQTNLKFGEQKRVFSLIPALKNAEFLRYGVMHRNSFIDAPRVLNEFFQLKATPSVFIAGQLSGVEGYMESAMSGLIAGINASNLINNQSLFKMPSQTITGALTNHLTSPNADFQPMNANFGILPPLTEKIKDKAARKLAYTHRALEALTKILEQ